MTLVFTQSRKFISNQRGGFSPFLKGKQMSKYVVQVCMTYVHIVDVEADDKEIAKQKAFYDFDITQAMLGEGECHVIEIDGEKVWKHL